MFVIAKLCVKGLCNATSLIFTFIQSFINSFIESVIQSFIQSIIQSVIHSFIHSFIHLFSTPLTILLPTPSAPPSQVYRFYEYWINFESWRDFTGVGAEHKIDDAMSRDEKRYYAKVL